MDPVLKNKPPVVMLANTHKPFDTRIYQKEAASLYAHGYDVTIIVPHHESLTVDGIRIIGVPVPKNGWQQLFTCQWQILRKAKSLWRNSIMHIQDAELIMVGFVLKLLGRKVIYDAHEDTPLQIRYQHWIPRLLRRPYAAFYYIIEKLAGWLFDAIIVAEPVLQKYYPEKKLTSFVAESSLVPRPAAAITALFGNKFSFL